MNIYDTEGELLYESDAETMRGAVEEAVRGGADLTRATLYGANLAAANLAAVHFADANLYGADLTGANLVGANLVGAYLTRATLYGANLYRANLEGANLYRANLEGANLTDAILTGANLAYVRGIIDGGTDSRGFRWAAVQHDDGPRIAAGCRWYTLAQAHEHWDGAHEQGEVVAIECRSRLALLETLAKSRGWLR